MNKRRDLPLAERSVKNQFNRAKKNVSQIKPLKTLA
jgi:hypothetical protein